MLAGRLRRAGVAPATLLISKGILWITALLFKRVRMQSDQLADISPKEATRQGKSGQARKKLEGKHPTPTYLEMISL